MNTSPPTTLPSPPSFSKYIRPDQNHHDHLESEPEPELSIFDAKKYFNYEESYPTNKQPQPHHHLINLPPPRLSSSSSIDSSSYGLRNHRPRSFISTPTASSEASWNSKTGLLSNPPGAIHVSIKNCDDNDNNKKKSACKWLLGSSKCLCSGGESVQVEDNYKLQQQPYKTPPHHFYNKDKISSPNTSTSTSTTAFTFPRLPNEFLDPPRESLEVFHPSRKLSSDPIQSHRVLFPRQPPGFAFPVSPSKSRMGSTDIDDVASDASSDLFEIESFSTQTTTLDENPRFLYCHMEEEEEEGRGYYEPSEASIEWSVTTAEGFDRASVTNMSSVTAMEIDEMVSKTKRREKEREGSSSLLMSCRCEKAVSVAVGPNPVKSGSGGTEESGGGGTRHVNCGSISNRACNNKPLARSRASRLSVT